MFANVNNSSCSDNEVENRTVVKIFGPLEFLVVSSLGSSFGRTFSFSDPVDTVSAAEVFDMDLDCELEERSGDFICG